MLGGEERVEGGSASRIVHPRTVVFEFDQDALTRTRRARWRGLVGLDGAGAHRQLSPSGHGVAGVDAGIEEHLVKLRSTTVDE